MGTAKIVLFTLLTLAVAVLAGAFAVVWGGLYDTAATQQHFQPVYSMIERAMRQSVRLRARAVEVPPMLDAPQLIARGAGCFRDRCVVCHGAPGVAQSPFGQSMQPLPGPLMDAAHRWKPRELYWLTRNGIRMSGMPAWQFHLSDEDLWAVVAFLQKLPELSPREYAQSADPASAPACKAPRSAGGPARAADAARGRVALTQYACSACHTIPGVAGSYPQVGPPLSGMARRTFIAGRLPNTPDTLVRWITRTHEVDPRSAMPDMGVSEQDARDIAAYLATLD